MRSIRMPVLSVLTMAVSVTAHATLVMVPAQYSSIQSAVTAAVSGDTILVAPGLYSENVLITAKALTLIGDSAAQSVIVQSATSSLAVMHWKDVVSSEAQIVGFTVQNAISAPGILCENSPVQIRKCLIQGNSGSGIRVTGTVTAVIADNVITGNSAYGGGGISLDEGGADVAGNTIIGNTASLGGGIFSDNRIGLAASQLAASVPAFVIRNNIITGNSATLGGGGAYLYEGFPVTFVGNLFAHDTAASGGGIANSGRYNLHLYSNTFDRCIGGNIGGCAIWWANDAIVGGVIRNNIITNCLSTFGVGGAIGGDPDVVGLVDIDYNDLWNNFPANYYRLQSGPDSISVDPLYCDANNGNYRLNAASPCLGTGDGGADIGAFGAGCQGAGPFVSSLQLPLEEPYHVIDHTPLLSWQYSDPGANAQTAYEIEAGMDADWSVAELWQSGAVAGSSTSVEYAGSPLLDGEVYYARVRASNGAAWSNWVSAAFRLNSPPSVPILVDPPDGQDVSYQSPYLEVGAGTDAENDPQTYRFEVYSDALLTQLIRSRDFSLSYLPAEFWQVSPSLPDGGTYWWRAMASDGYETSGWSPASSFRVDAVPDPPLPFALLSPTNGEKVYTQSVAFDWEDAIEPDPNDEIDEYILTLSRDANFIFATTVPGILASHYQYASLPFGAQYWWYVTARDEQGLTRVSGVSSFVIPSPGDINGDFIFNVTDIVKLIDMVFRSGAAPPGILAVDVNGDCIIDIRDVVRLIDFILRGGPVPDKVCQPTPPPGTRICVPMDYSTIQAAVDVANDGDTICVSPGVYTEEVVIDAKCLVLLGDSVNQSSILQPLVSGATIVSLLGASSRDCQIVGFLFRGTEYAPAISMQSSSATIRLNRFEDNIGGGIYAFGSGSPLIEKNQFSRNTRSQGGAVSLYNCSADVIGNSFDANHGNVGGAYYLYGGSGSRVESNTFRGNVADAGGGAIYLYAEGAMTIVHNLFVSDTSDHGGGIAVSGRDSVAIANNTFDRCVGGTGFGGGNAMWWANGSDVACAFKNNIVTNSKSINGLGGAVGGDEGVVGFIELGFNSFLNNTPVNFYRFAPGVGTLTSDPLYCNSALGDYHLSSGSPCLGSGEGGLDRGAFGVGCGP